MLHNQLKSHLLQEALLNPLLEASSHSSQFL